MDIAKFLGIRKVSRDLYWWIFTAQLMMFGTYLSIFELQIAQHPSAYHALSSIIAGMGLAGAANAAATYVETEVIMFIADQLYEWKVRRIQKTERRKMRAEMEEHWEMMRREGKVASDEPFPQRFLTITMPPDEVDHFEQAKHEAAQSISVAWQAWYGRKKLAEEAGKPFTEPPPSFSE